MSFDFPFLNHSKPLVIAHRGASAHAIENTWKAFELAKDFGADGLELDVFFTQDRQFVVCHDQRPVRLTGQLTDLRRASSAEIKALHHSDGQSLPFLRDVLEAFLPHFKVINIEIKSHGVRPTGLEQALVFMLDQLNAWQKVLISSFNPVHLWRLRRLKPGSALGYLLAAEQPWVAKQKRTLGLIAPQTLNIDGSLFKEPAFQGHFDLNIPKWIWTVNEEEEMAFWIQKNVSAIITNHPDRMRALLSE